MQVRVESAIGPPNRSLEATGSAAEFAIDGPILIFWRASVRECPGASARGC